MTASLLNLALALAALGLIFTVARHASAAGDSMISVDMTPDASQASAGIGTCAAVQPGDTFDADVFISNAQDLVEFELRVDFNPDVVSLTSADYGYFLTQSGGQIMAPLFDSEKPGRKFLAASEPSHPDSGSGVLARLHLLALSAGTSPLTITSTPTVYGPRLTSAGGVPFEDSNGDGIFDGSLTGGTIDVGQTCAPSTPVVTPSPITTHTTPTPKPGGQTPPPHPSGAPTTAPNSGGGDQTPAPGDPQTTPASSDFVINPPPPTAGSGGGANDVSGDGSSSGDDNGASSGRSSDQTGQDNSPGGQDPTAGQSNDGSSSNLIVIIAGAFATIAVLLGATFLVMQAHWKRSGQE